MYRFHKVGKSGDFSPCEGQGGLLRFAPISRTTSQAHFSIDGSMNVASYSRLRNVLAVSCALACGLELALAAPAISPTLPPTAELERALERIQSRQPGARSQFERESVAPGDMRGGILT